MAARRHRRGQRGRPAPAGAAAALARAPRRRDGRLEPRRPAGARAVPRGRHEQLLPAHAPGEQRALAGQPAAAGLAAAHAQPGEGAALGAPTPAALSALHQGLLAHRQPAPAREALLPQQPQERVQAQARPDGRRGRAARQARAARGRRALQGQAGAARARASPVLRARRAERPQEPPQERRNAAPSGPQRRPRLTAHRRRKYSGPRRRTESGPGSRQPGGLSVHFLSAATSFGSIGPVFELLRAFFGKGIKREDFGICSTARIAPQPRILSEFVSLQLFTNVSFI